MMALRQGSYIAREIAQRQLLKPVILPPHIRNNVGEPFVSGCASRQLSNNTPGNRTPYKVLYDGDCPLCVREVNALKKLNRRPGSMNFVDIQGGPYKPDDHNGITYEEAMGLLHVIGPDNKIYIGMEGTRKLYDAVGLGWVMAWTKIPGINNITDQAYSWFANNRYKITGRENPCDDPGRCKITGLKNKDTATKK